MHYGDVEPVVGGCARAGGENRTAGCQFDRRWALRSGYQTEWEKDLRYRVNDNPNMDSGTLRMPYSRMNSIIG